MALERLYLVREWHYNMCRGLLGIRLTLKHVYLALGGHCNMCRPTWYSDGTVTFVLVLEWHYNMCTWYSTGTVTCVLGTRLAILYNNYTVTRAYLGIFRFNSPEVTTIL